MKIFAFGALALVLLMATGCKKKDNNSTETMNMEEASQSATEMTPTVAESMEPVEDTTEAVVQKVTEASKEAVSALQIKAEDVAADLKQSVDDLKQKAATFDTTQLQAYVEKYTEMIRDKKDQLEAETAKLKEIPVTEMMGEKAKAIKEQLAQYTDELAALKDRSAVYIDQLKARIASPTPPTTSPPAP